MCVTCMGRVEKDVLVRLMYFSSVGLEDKGGIQSDLPMNGCLCRSGLFLKKCLILREKEKKGGTEGEREEGREVASSPGSLLVLREPGTRLGEREGEGRARKSEGREGRMEGAREERGGRK